MYTIKCTKKFLKRERGLRVKRGRILNRKRRTKTSNVESVDVEVVAVRRAAIPRAKVPTAAA